MQKLKIFFLSLILILSISTGVRAEYFSDVIVTSSDGIWTDSRAYTTLNDAIAAVGTNQRTVVIASPQTVTALTVPSTVTLKFERDGAIVNSGQLTINTKNIISDGHKIFAGLGDIDFASGTVVKLSWFHNLWNALTMTSDDYVTMVIDKAINATASVAVGNDVTLRWEAPNIISANAGVTVSNIGQIEAGSYQILAGAGNFRFRDGTSLNLEWFPYLRMALTWINTNEVTLIVNESSPVDYSDSIPSNIQIKVNEGGNLDISPGITLTIDDAKQMDIGPYYFDPFTGAGSVEIAGGLTYTPATTLTASVLAQLSIDSIITDYNYEVDALMSYGNGTDYNDTTLMAACTAVGANAVTILVRPGTWTQAANKDYTAVCPNAVFKLVPGAIISHDAFTLYIPYIATEGGIPYQVLSGTGLVSFGETVNETYPELWGVDGTADEVQINAAIKSLANGGVVQLQGTTYTLASYINPRTKITLRGKGQSTIIKEIATFGDVCAIKADLTVPQKEGILIEDLAIDGSDNTTGTTYSHGIYLNSASKSTIRNCYIRNTKGDGICIGNRYTNYGVQSTDIIVENNFIAGCARNGISDGGGQRHIFKNNYINGVNLNGFDIEPDLNEPIKDIIISNNQIYNVTRYGIVIAYSFVTTATNKVGLIISDNIIDTTGNIGILLDDVLGSTVSGNKVFNAGSIGIYSDLGSTNNDILNNTIYHPAGECIKIGQGVMNVIGNNLNANAANAIYAGNEGGVISHNRIVASGGHYGITLQSNAKYTIVSNNYLDGTDSTAGGIGIYHISASYCHILDNTLVNWKDGINLLRSSSDTTLLGDNIFYNNVRNVYDGRAFTTTPVTLSTVGISQFDAKAGPITATLPDGEYKGQRKICLAITSANHTILTVTHHETSDPEIFLFNEAYDYLELVWGGTKWLTVKNFGVAIP